MSSFDDPNKSIRVKSNIKPKDRPDRRGLSPRRKNPQRKTPRPLSMEQKFQLLFMVRSGKMSLSDLKSQYRATYVGAIDEYSDMDDQKDFFGTKARIEKLMRLTETRDMAKQRMIMMFKPKPKMTGNRADAIARFATGFRGSGNWSRYKPMVLKPKKYNPPRYGSSKGEIGKSKYIGFKKFNKDFDRMMKSLVNLTGAKGVTGKKIAGRLKRIKAGINVKVRG